MKKIHKVTLETRNFSFEAYGVNKESAYINLGMSLVKHGLQYQLPVGWHEQYKDDINYSVVELGCGYRDGEKL